MPGLRLMNHEPMRRFALTCLSLASLATAIAGEVTFSYSNPNSRPYVWGTGKAETYDVAILLPEGVLAGSKVSSLTLPLSGELEIADASGWLSSGLLLSGSKNAPDIAQVEATADGPVLRATFAEPLEVASGTAYAGFSFTITAASDDWNKNPLTVTEAIDPDGFWIHSSKTYRKWAEKSTTLGVVLALSVELEGDFHDTAAAPECPAVNSEPGKAFELPVTVVNHGKTEISYVELAVDIPGSGTQTFEVPFFPPISSVYGSKGFNRLMLDAPQGSGTLDMTVTITKVNGEENPDGAKCQTVPLTLFSFLPVMRPLMEEYTGLWCGYCPRGFVALETMKDRYPDRFVGVSYHAKGDKPEVMQVLQRFPNSVGGFPGAVMNRSLDCDPYFGNSNSGFGIEPLWQELADSFAPADLGVELEWADDSHSWLKATSTVRYVSLDASKNCQVSYMLVADNLHGPVMQEPVVSDDPTEEEKAAMKAWNTWLQSNYYSGEAIPEGNGWEQFCYGGSKVGGLVFNDVVVLYPSEQMMRGVEGSADNPDPTTLTRSNEYLFDASRIVNIDGEEFVNPDARLRCVAVLLDGATGAFVNCNTSQPVSLSGVGKVPAADAPATEAYYDLAGRATHSTAKGFSIKVETDAQGHRTVRKVVR